MSSPGPYFSSHPQSSSPSAPPPRTSQLVIWSFVLSVLGFCAPGPGIAAVICGHLGLSNIKKSAGTLTGSGLGIAGLVIGYITLTAWILLVTLIVIGGALSGKFMKEWEENSFELFPLSDTLNPIYPELSDLDFKTLQPSGVRVAQVELGEPGQEASIPGWAMSLRIYLPADSSDADDQSLPCVLVAPAGTNLLSGSYLEPLDEYAYHDETLPYAEAGMVTILYSIDGEDPEVADPDDDEALSLEMKDAYHEFLKAGAGTVNGRNAFEFALSQLPMVDPDRVYSAGHSSAGTLSLLLAAHEPRLRGCLAYAPVVDIERHFSDLTSEPGVGLILPGIRYFVKRSSPLTHTAKLIVPVFLFFADDDEMIDSDAFQPFIDQLKTTNSSVTVEEVPSGGHYDSMIGEGIPAGIEWIKMRETAEAPLP